MISTSCELYHLMVQNKTDYTSFSHWSYLQFLPRAFHIYSSLFSWESYCKIYLLNICMVLFKYTMWCVYLFKGVLCLLCEWVCEGTCIPALVQRSEENGRSSCLHHVGHRGSNSGLQCWQQALLAIGPHLLFMPWDLSPPFIKKNERNKNETSRSYRIELFMYYIYLYKNSKVFYSPRHI